MRQHLAEWRIGERAFQLAAVATGQPHGGIMCRGDSLTDEPRFAHSCFATADNLPVSPARLGRVVRNAASASTRPMSVGETNKQEG